MRNARTSGVARPVALTASLVVAATVWLFAGTVGANPLAPQSSQPSEVEAAGSAARSDVIEPARFDRGVLWAPVTPFVDLGKGGVASAGPECLCNQDCDLGNPCAGGICTGGECSTDASSANGVACDDGNADGFFCTTGLCSDGTCLAEQGEGTTVCPGQAETCNDTDDRCENCVDDIDCPTDGVPDVCNPEICDPATKRCVLDFANLPCPEQTCDDDDEPGVPHCTGATDIGRCCLSGDTCVEDGTRAECDAGGGLFMTLNVCPCPKYGAGIAPDAVAQGQSNTVFELLIEPAGDCDTRSLLGDDYTLSNGSFLTLENTVITGVVEANNTDLEIKYYDTNFNLVLTFSALNLDAGSRLLAPTPFGAGNRVIPPEGWVTIEVTTDTGGFLWRSTDVVDVGTNNQDLLWENNTQGQILPAGLNVMRMEIIGTKTLPPVGVCCSADGMTCTTDQLPWECGDGSYVLNGSCPESCEVGSCCLANGFCCDSGNLDDDPGCTLTAISSQFGCETDGGTFNGFATDCSLDCCLQDITGASVCTDAVDHPLDVSGVCVPDPKNPGQALCPTDSVTISGDNRETTNGVCDISGTPCATNTVPGQPVSCPEGEICVLNANHCSALGGTAADADEPIPVYYEKFSINNWSRVAIDYCGSGTCPGTDPGPGPLGGGFVRYIIILDGCQVDGEMSNCGDFIFRDIDLSGGLVCEDQNSADIYTDLAPGTYWAPVFSGKTCEFSVDACLTDDDCRTCELDNSIDCAEDSDCSGVGGVCGVDLCVNSEMNYQMHIVATALPPQVCCLVEDNTPVCETLPKPQCDSLGGFSVNNAPICTFGACIKGACCTGPGECVDGEGVGITLNDCSLLGGDYFGAARCTDDPCPVCTIDDPANCQADNSQTPAFILNVDRAVTEEGLPDPLWADDFRAPGVGPVAIDTICWSPCFFNPFDGIECADNPPPDNFDITIYNDAGGLPGTVVGAGTQPLNVIAKEDGGPGSRCWRYSGAPGNAPVVNGGGCYWMQITGTGQGEDGGGCTVYWLTSDQGNSYSAFDNDGAWGPEDVITMIADPPVSEVDLSFCVSTGMDPDGCGVFLGACCLCGADCQGGLDANACFDQDGFFFPGQSCDGLACPDAIEEGHVNDDCTAATVLEHPGGDPLNDIVIDFDTRCATTDGPDAPFNGCADTGAGNEAPFTNDLWYEYNPPCCGTVTASMCPPDGGAALYDSLVVLYGGLSTCSCPDDMSLSIECDDSGCGIGGGPSLLEAPVFQNKCYLLRVGGSPDSGTGTMVLSIECGECPAEVGRPNPDPELGLGVVAGSLVQPCNTVADCSGFGTAPNVDCIPQPNGLFPGTCYASAARYLSVAPNPGNTSQTARRVSMDRKTCSSFGNTCGTAEDCRECSDFGTACTDDFDCPGEKTCDRLQHCSGDDVFEPGVDYVLGWVAEPFATVVAGPEPSPQAHARLQGTSKFRNWGDLTDINPAFTGSVPVRIGDCEITPKGPAPDVVGNVYFIQSINLGDDESDEGNYSVPLRLRTTSRHGDPVGTGNYPNQGVSLLDAFAAVKGFQGTQLVPKWRLEMTGAGLVGADNLPDFGNINLADVFEIVGAFQTGGVYVYHQPCECDGQPCP